MDIQTSEAKYLNLANDKSVLSLKVPENIISKWFEGKRREFVLYIVLDISGSMAGSGLNQAKESILNLMESLFEKSMLTEENVTCFFFQSECEVKRFADDRSLLWSNGAIKNYFDGINAYGGTNFDPVFQMIVEQVNDVNSDLAIIFFTDGQGYYTDDCKQDLEVALSHTGFNTEIHTIGFTGSHDAALLSWLTKLGTKQGNFQYVKSSGEIKSTMKTTLELLELGDRTLYMKLGERELLPIEFDNEGHGKLVLTGDAAKVEGHKISIFKEQESNETFDFESTPIQIQPDDPTATLLTIPYIQFEITRLTNEIINCTIQIEEEKRKRFKEILEESNNYDEQLNNILNTAFKTKSASRSEIIQQSMELKGTILQFKDILSDALKGTLTNQKIASFNNLAYKNITKQRLKKKLDDRSIKNLERMEEVEKKIEEIVRTLDFDELESQESEENLSTYTCTVTTDNYIEAMKEGECICLTLDVERSEAAIADPSQITIKKITQSLLSSGAFLDSVTFAMADKYTAESVHGGFQRGNISASILQGLARENITGVLPLYINDKHWSIAREKIKPIMGYLVTLDIFGYTYSQITTVPFLVLARALADTSTEFKRRQAKWVLETCDVIYKQSKILREDNKKLFENYIKIPANRTIEHVSNNLIFLGHLLCALRCGDVDVKDLQKWLQEGLMKILIEEFIRRRLNKWQALESMMEDISKVLGISQSVYIDEPVKEFEKHYVEFINSIMSSEKCANIIYADAFKKAKALGGSADLNKVSVDVEPMDVDVEKMDEPKVKINSPTVKTLLYDPNTYQIPDHAFSIIAKIKKSVTGFVEVMLRYNKIFESIIAGSNANSSFLDNPEFEFEENKTPLTDAFFDQYSSKVILATFLQAYLQRQNSVRREAVEADPPKYYEPFSDDTADVLLAAHFNEYVSNALKKKTNDVIKTYTSKKDGAIGFSFWQMDNIEEAAGLLLIEVKFRGNKLYGQILKSLQKPNMSLAKEKIEMVISGTWQGVTLFADKPKHPEDPEKLAKFIDNAHWFPNRQKVYRILTAHKSYIPDINYWTRVLPPYKGYIEHQFDDEYIKEKKIAGIEAKKAKKLNKKR
ncbi:17837_t:CDS:2 [Funneliformis caledonium]|uniref:17837_t:CDS:1 n=1 Tax=Funneliformis caledonium TaxID=1117310 RepID=A0A9N9AWF1_9GLOM|nr:17837_t:CDS:2 [Funneliformis caledonium]